MSDLWEAVEPEPIEASHLLRARCTGRGGLCGAAALCAPGRQHAARCAACWGGSVAVSELAGRYAPIVGYEMRRVPAAEGGREPYPAPEVTTRDERAGLVRAPGAVNGLAQTASALGWTVRVARSRGCPPHGATGRPTAVRDLFSVRCLRDGWGAYAVYAGTTWVSVMMWGVTLPWFPAGSVTDLRAFLADPGRPGDWFDAIRRREADKRARAAARPKTTGKDREGLR